MFLLRSRPHDSKPKEKKPYHQDKAQCDNCDSFGIWWNIEGMVVCDKCLGFGLTRDDQRAIVRNLGEGDLYRRLSIRANELFNQGEDMKYKDGDWASVNGHGKSVIDNGKTTKEDVEGIRKELRKREGKLYGGFERIYIEAAKKARKLVDDAAAASIVAKDAKDKYEAEKFAIDELKRKFILLRIG